MKQDSTTGSNQWLDAAPNPRGTNFSLSRDAERVDLGSTSRAEGRSAVTLHVPANQAIHALNFVTI